MEYAMIQRITLILAALALLAIPVLAQETENSMLYNGIGFTYSPELGTNVNVMDYPGDPVDLEQPGGPVPPHTAFFFYDDLMNNYGWAAADATITVFNVGALAGYEFYETELTRLRDILAQRPDLSTFEVMPETGGQNLPFLPVFPAAQSIRSRTSYIDTQSLSGVAYVTLYRQDVSPFLANEFLYTIQALSADGQYYISAIQQVDVAGFPTEYPTDLNYEEFSANFGTYLAESIATIDNADPSALTPSPDLITNAMNSLSIGVPTVANPGDVVSPTVTAPVVNTDPTLGGLAGTWTLVSYGAADAPTAAVADIPATLTFSEGGVNGNVGCNGFSGAFIYENNTLTITSPIISTLMACAEPIMQQESTVINGLAGAQTFAVQGDTLTITYTTADGVSGVLTLARAA